MAYNTVKIVRKTKYDDSECKCPPYKNMLVQTFIYKTVLAFCHKHHGFCLSAGTWPVRNSKLEDGPTIPAVFTVQQTACLHCCLSPFTSPSYAGLRWQASKGAEAVVSGQGRRFIDPTGHATVCSLAVAQLLTFLKNCLLVGDYGANPIISPFISVAVCCNLIYWTSSP